MALTDVLREVKADLRTIPGLATLLENPPEQLSGFPTLLVYAGPVAWRLGSADGGRGVPMRWGLCTVRIELYVVRDTLPLAIERAMPFTESIPHALFVGFADDKFGGTVVTLGEAQARGGTAPIRSEFGPDDWGTELVRLRFELDVSIEEEILV